MWISKLPARTFDATFDAAYVTPAAATFPAQTCTVTTSDASVTTTDVAFEGVDVTSIVKAKVLAPVRDKRTP